MAWSGECSGSMAQGEGSLTGNYTWDDDLGVIIEAMGHLQNGRKHGHWITLFPNENVKKSTYANGVLHGRWVFRSESGEVEEAIFMNGERQE